MKYETGSVAEELVERGRIEGREEIVLRLISKGMDNAEIADLTGFSLKAITKIRKSIDPSK